MLGSHQCIRTVSSFAPFTDPANARRSVKHFIIASSSSLRFCRFRKKSLRMHLKSIIIYCQSSSRGSFFDSRSSNGDDQEHDYLEASLLIPDTILHYHTRTQRSDNRLKLQSSGKLFASTFQSKELTVGAIAQDLVRHIQSPTFFLKISCDGDYLLPISVGEHAIQGLIDTFQDNANGSCPDQFELVRDASKRLGYEVKMVKIIERVVNTYHARIYFVKSRENNVLSVDARPSDAIILANICKVPIFVSKQIVLADAIRISHGIGRLHNRKSAYDVTLDSAADGRDILSEELGLLMNMDLAAKEERYNDAAMLKEKLMKLRKNI